MAKRHNFELYTRKKLTKQRQTITIKKLNTIKNMMHDLTIQQIQRAIGMGKSTTNKWYALVEKKMKSDKLAELLNLKENLATLLNPIENRGPFISGKLRKKIHQILAEITNLNSKKVHYKLNERKFEIKLDKTRKVIN